MAEVATLTLANICLDVQIGICMYLHPCDILALRNTCKALQLSTRKRVVWVAALHRVCLDNTLFLPSFPISDMSDLELERAAMAPHRWIELCGAFEKQHLNDPQAGATLRPRAVRIIDGPPFINDFFIVPGGRYLVGSARHAIFVWDLGRTSSVDCKLIISVRLEGHNTCMVQATPDGMGLIILSCVILEWSTSGSGCVYEIYPQSETPHLTKIAHLDFNPIMDRPAFLLPGTVIWFGFSNYRIVFRVWDYRLNHSTSFSVDIDVVKFERNLEVMATKTAVIILCKEAVLICAIPPLSPQPPDFHDPNFTHIPPLFTIPFPDGIVLHSKLIRWQTISSWYFGSTQPLYFDMLCEDSILHRFKIMLKPDLSAATLHVVNTSELTAHKFDYVSFEDYRICEDTLVSCWSYPRLYQFQSGIYTGLTSARFSDLISNGGPAAMMTLPHIQVGCGHLFYLCPASGRYVVYGVDGIIFGFY